MKLCNSTSHFLLSISQEQPPDFPDNSNAYRKCHSQFTDTGDYKRFGRNTFQDESGIYANTQLKRDLFQPTQTIPKVLEWWSCQKFLIDLKFVFHDECWHFAIWANHFQSNRTMMVTRNSSGMEFSVSLWLLKLWKLLLLKLFSTTRMCRQISVSEVV